MTHFGTSESFGDLTPGGFFFSAFFPRNISQLLSKEQLGGVEFSMAAASCPPLLILSGLPLAENSLVLYHTGVVG